MFALQDIRDHRPCESGWKTLLLNLGNPPLTTCISLGDVAISNGSTDAWWCVRVFDLSNIDVRRNIIRALLPSVHRASAHTTDQRVHDTITTLIQWANGDNTVDLKAAAEAASAARTAAEAASAARTAAAEAAWTTRTAAAWATWAAWAAAEVAWAAARTVEDASWAAEAATWAVTAAKEATWATGTATWAAATAAAASEEARQVTDLITHFPPLILNTSPGSACGAILGPRFAPSNVVP